MWRIRALVPLGSSGQGVCALGASSHPDSFPPLCFQGSPGTGAESCPIWGVSAPGLCPREGPIGGHKPAACAHSTDGTTETSPDRNSATAKIATPALAHGWGQDGAWGAPGPQGQRTKGQRTWSSTRGGQGWSPRFPLLIPSRLQDESGPGPKALLAPSCGGHGQGGSEAGGWEPLGWDQGLEFSVLKGPVSSGSPE